MAEESIIIKGGSVDIEFGDSLAPRDHNGQEVAIPTIYRKFSCSARIKQVVIRDAEGRVMIDLLEEPSKGLKWTITVVYE